MRPELSSPARFRTQGGSPESDGEGRTKEILVSIFFLLFFCYIYSTVMVPNIVYNCEIMTIIETHVTEENTLNKKVSRLFIFQNPPHPPKVNHWFTFLYFYSLCSQSQFNLIGLTPSICIQFLLFVI